MPHGSRHDFEKTGGTLWLGPQRSPPAAINLNVSLWAGKLLLSLLKVKSSVLDLCACVRYRPLAPEVSNLYPLDTCHKYDRPNIVSSQQMGNKILY